MAARMEPTEGHRSVKAAVASVADALTAHGFAAHAETRGNALTLVAEHCPFGEAARQYPHVLCAVDTGMVKGMLEGLYGETAADDRAESPARRRQLRHPRLRRSALARAYLDHASSSPLRPGRARRDAPVPARAPRRSRAGCTPKGA